MSKTFTHFDSEGRAIMVDVANKEVTHRTATAQGSILVSREILSAIEGKTAKKGDVLGVARVAGIIAVKQTASLIPMCHTLLITRAAIEFSLGEDRVTAWCTVECDGKTGVEMEALTGVSTALLTIYDMCKAMSKEMVITDIHLTSKTGGKSGDFSFGGPAHD